MKRFIQWFFTLVLLCSVGQLKAEDYYWVGGSGEWSNIDNWATTSGGNIRPLVIPAFTDNVYFDENSFTSTGQIVTINSDNVSCHDMDWTGALFSPRIKGKLLRIGGSLTLTLNMFFDITDGLSFESASTGEMISTLGKDLPNLTFDGPGGQWTILNNLIMPDNTITIKNGTITMIDKRLECRGVIGNGVNPKSMDFTNTTIILHGNGMVWDFNGTNFTSSFNKSSIYLKGVDARFSHVGTPVKYHNVFFLDTKNTGYLMGEGAVFDTVRFFHDSSIEGDNTFVHLWYSIKTINSLASQSTQTILGSWKSNGACNENNEIFSSFQSFPANISMATQHDFFYVKLLGISFVNNSAVATYSDNQGGNSGIDFTPDVSRVLYWVGGGGSWHDPSHWSLSSGGPGGECFPTRLDDVFFDGNSFDLLEEKVLATEDSAECRNMDWTGADLSPQFRGGVLSIYGSLILNGTMDESMSNILFMAEELGHTILTNGAEVNSEVAFEGIGGGWTLLDNFNARQHTITHKHGTLITNSVDMHMGKFMTDYTFDRSLFLGSSQIYIDPLARVAWAFNGGNMIFDAGTSHIHIDCTGDEENSFSFTTRGAEEMFFYDLSFENSYALGKIIGTTSFHDVLFETNGQIDNSIFAHDLTLTKGFSHEWGAGVVIDISNKFTADGNCQDPISIYTTPNDSAFVVQSLGGNFDINYVTLENIIAVDSGGVYTVYDGVDLGKNTNWEFVNSESNQLYWIGNNGKWNDGLHWSLTDGGPPSYCIPKPNTDVFFTSNSFTLPNQKVKVDSVTAFCHSMSWVGARFSPEFDVTQNLRIYGSLEFIEEMRLNMIKPVFFVSYEMGNTITMATQVFGAEVPVFFDREVGGWILQDEFVTAAQMTLKSGTLNTNDQHVNAKSMRIPNTFKTHLILGETKFDVMANGPSWYVDRGKFTLDAGTSEIRLYGSDCSMLHIRKAVKTLTYYDVTFMNKGGEGAMNTTGDMAFNEVTFIGDGQIKGLPTKPDYYEILTFSPGKTYFFEDGIVTQIGTRLNSRGNCTKYISIGAEEESTIEFMGSTGTIIVDYNKVSRLNAITQTGEPFLARSSVDIGGNDNWDFTEKGSSAFYWIGGSGSWSDTLHWSGESGGEPLGGCIPGPEDDVYFDENSFTAEGQNVNVDITNAQCHSMWWTGAQFTPSFLGNPPMVYGSLELNENMTNNITGMRFLTTELGHTIATKTRPFLGDILFMGTGEWTLLDDLTMVNSSVYHESGSLNLDGNKLVANNFGSGFYNPTNTKKLDISESDITLSSAGVAWYADAGNLDFIATNSTINITGNNGALAVTNGGLDFHNVNFQDMIGYNILDVDQSSFNYVHFYGDGKVYGSNSFDTLRYTAAHKYIMEAGQTQTINDLFHARGNNCFLVVIHSDDIPNPTYISKANGSVDCDFLELRAVHAVGGATFNAGTFSTDAGNNMGWDFTSSGFYEYGLGSDTTVFFCSDLDTFFVQTLDFNGGVAWQWNDGSTGSTLPVTESGDYSVRVSFALDCDVADTIHVEVNRFELISPRSPIMCDGDNAQLSVNDARTGYDYLWNTGDESPVIEIQPANTTEYTVEVSYGTYTCRDSIEVLVTAPYFTFDVTDVLCNGEANGSVKAFMNDSYGTVDYTWKDGPLSDTYADLDTGWYYVSAIDSLGCDVTDSVYVGQPDSLKMTFDLPTILCNGDAVPVGVTAVGGVGPFDFDWKGFNSNEITAGSYEVTVIDSNGCTTDSSFVLSQPDVLSGDLNLNHLNCPEDNNGQAVVAGLGGVGNYSYEWSNGGGSAVKNFLPLGSYSVTVSDSNSCDTTINFEIISLGAVEALFDLFNPDGKRPFAVDINNMTTGGNKYEWFFSDTETILTGEKPEYTFDIAGDHYIELTATDTIYGCTSVYRIEVHVESDPNISTPNVFTPNADGNNDIFYVTGDDIEQLNVTIYGRWGDKVYEFEGMDNTWNGTNQSGKELPEGTYFYSLRAVDLDGREIFKQGHVTLSR